MDEKAKGLVYVFTGDGKGKTSAALGVAMRAAGQGKRAAMVQWYKEKRWQIGEHKLPELLKQPLFEIYPMGQGFYKLPTDHATPKQHKQAAQEALELAAKLLEGEMVKMAENGYNGLKNSPAEQGPALQDNHFDHSNNSGHLFLLILDEALNAVNDKLIDLIDLINLISKRGQTHIILTGRNAPKKLVDLADLVTEMKNIKHPFEKGKKAVLGLDF